MLADILPYRALERTLANGLRVIAVPTGFPNLVSLQIPVQTGSRNEVEPGKSGFAHFFEHMMFRGTPRFPNEAYEAVITRAGARQNAYTTDDYTNYHITCAAEDLETILDLEADRFMNLAYSEGDFKTEARAVLGEYNKSAADPLTKLLEVQRAHAFTTHTYKHTTMGFIADIEDMPNQFEYSKTFFERWYRPDNTTVIVAGDIDPEATFALVEKYWGPWASAPAARVVIPEEPAQPRAVVVHHHWGSPTLPWMSVGFHGPAFSESEQEFAALDVLLDLSFGETSELYRRLVEQEQIVDEFFPYLPSSADPGLATIFARVKKLGDLASVRNSVIEVLAAARDVPVTPERLEEAKSHARYSFVRTLDNSESIAATLARYVRHRRSYETLNALFRVYDSLTPADLQAAARRFIQDDNLVVTTLTHEHLGEDLGARPSLASFAARPAASPPPILVQASESPLLRFKFVFNGGSAYDPRGKEGLASLAAAMVADAGSATHRIDEINRALFPMAGSFESQVDKEMTTFTGVIHKDQAMKFAEIVLSQLVTPGYRQDDFSRLKESQLNALVQDLRANNEEALGKERLQANLFAGTRYAHPPVGTVAGIGAITLDDVRRFAATHYVSLNLSAGAAGALPEDFIGAVGIALGQLPRGTPATPPSVVAHQPRGVSIEIVQKDTRSVAISLGHPIEVTRSHPDFVALWLARTWLGEHRASNGRLYQRIREIRGVNYGAYAYIEAFPSGMYQFFPDPNRARHHQLFEIWIRPVRPEQAVIALKIALHELERLVVDGLSEEDFEQTREYLRKNVFVMTKTQDQQLGYALDSQWHGIGEFTGFMRDGLAALTADAVNAAIRRHLSYEDLAVVMIAGDAQALRDELLAGGFSPISYDGEKPGELLAEDQLIGARQLNLTEESIEVTPVEAVFAD